MALTGVSQAEIGPRYDFAMGVDTGSGTVNMVGYTLKAGTEWSEAIDIQDNDRIIQIASPNSTDRFTYFPKVSQGDWSGGERQVTFVDPTRYYQSTKLEVSIPGHLYIHGYYNNVAIPANMGQISLMSYTSNFGNFGRPIGYDPNTNSTYVATQGGTAGNLITIAYNGGNSPQAATGSGVGGTGAALRGIYILPDGSYASSSAASPGIYQLPSARVTTSLTETAFITPGIVGFAGNIYYVQNGAAAQNPIRQVVETSHNAWGAPSNAFTPNGLDGNINLMGRTSSGILFVTTVQNATTSESVYNQFYLFDGVTSTLVGDSLLLAIDIQEANGVTFILCAVGGANSGTGIFQAPIILYYYQGQLAVFDDYRYLPSDFVQRSAPIGNLATDGTFLYLSWPGMRTKRYDLRVFPNVSVCDIGWQSFAHNTNLTGHNVAAGGRTWTETVSTSSFGAGGDEIRFVVPGFGNTLANETGTLVTSYFDMGVPTTTKIFRSLEIELNAALGTGAAITVQYNLDNQTGFANSLTVHTLANNNNLICFFPNYTKASRVQLQIQFTSSNAGVSPDIRSYSLNARLGRVWKGTLQCRRQILLHDGSTDAQGTQSRDLINNVVSAYVSAAGNCVLFVPDVTNSSGTGTFTSQINAVLEEYTVRSPKPGPSFDEFGATDMEADIDFTFVERL